MVNAEKHQQIQSSDIFAALKEVPDLLDFHELATDENSARLILGKKDSKAPLEKAWNKTICSRDAIIAHQDGFAILLGYFPDGSHLVLVDIDIDNIEACLTVTKMFAEKLGDYCIIEETASGKFHMYFRVEGETNEDVHALGEQFKYASDFAVEELQDKPMGNDIEIFGGIANRNSKCFGSVIDGKTYHVASFSKHNKILEIPTIKAKDLEAQLEYALIENGFKAYFPEIDSDKLASNTNVSFVKSKDKQTIQNYFLKPFANFIIYILKQNDGSKHRILLAFGNYLSQYVQHDSVIKLIDKIIELEPTLFKSNTDAVNTVLKAYNDNDNEKHKTGAKTIWNKYACHCMTAQQFWFCLLWYCGAKVGFYPTGQQGMQYDYIEFNPWTKQVELQTIKHRKNDEGKYESYTHAVKPILGCEIISIKKIENSIVPSANAEYVLEYLPSGEYKIQTITGSTMKEIKEQFSQQIGIVQNSSYGYVFNQILSFFTRNNLIETSSTSPVGGIFFIDGKLRRFDYNLKEIAPTYNKNKLINGINLLKEVAEILPMDTNKFGSLVTESLWLPFAHVLKSKGFMVYYICLLGAGKTGKSFTASLMINTYNPTRINSVSGNTFNAGAASSPYQLGLKYGISSYPVVINESSKIFVDDEMTEVAKSSIESTISRSTADATYYSYSTMVLTSNVDIKMHDSIVRRCHSYYMSPNERLAESDIDKLAELLNESGVNSRFVEFNEIGQFCFTFLHKNPQLFDEYSTTEELSLRLVDELEKASGIDLDFMKHNTMEDSSTVIEELDNDTMAEFLTEIKKVYNFNFRNFNNIDYEDDKGLYYTPLMFAENNLINLITRGAINFLVYNAKDDRIFIVGNRVKAFFNKQGRLVSNNELFEDFAKFENQYDVKKTRMMVEGKYLRGIAIEPSLLTDLMNNSLRGDVLDE